MVKAMSFFYLLLVICVPQYLFAESDLKLKNRHAIKKACLNYVEGFYESNGKRIAKGVNEKLVKRIIGEDKKIHTMDRATLIKNAESKTYAKPAISVEIYDIYKNIATVKITSDFIDYVQVGKVNDTWQVINVLWTFK